MENRSGAYVEIILQGKLVRFPLISGSTCRIGRNRESEICLPDGSTSRDHALLKCTGGGMPYLSDLGSRNGTFVNGRRVGEPVALHCCDVIDIGHYRLSFHDTVAPRKSLSSSCNSRLRRADVLVAARRRSSGRYSVTARGNTPTRTAEGRLRER